MADRSAEAARTASVCGRPACATWSAWYGMSVVVCRAADRGEVPAAPDAAAGIQTVTPRLYYRLFVTAEPLGPAVADRAAAIATAAARAGALTAAPPGESPGDSR